jgi:hypothetical protein
MTMAAGNVAEKQSMNSGLDACEHQTRVIFGNLAKDCSNDPGLMSAVNQERRNFAQGAHDRRTADSEPAAPKPAHARPVAAASAAPPSQREVANSIVTHGTGHGARGTSPGWQRQHKPKGFNGPT